MKPIDFPQSTKVLQKPSTMSDNECSSLHVWNDGKQCVSCWKPTFKERMNILFGGKVWLGVLSGKTQPPVFVSGEMVFGKTPLKARILAFWGKAKESIIQTWENLAEAAKQPDKRKHFYVGFVIALVVGVLFGALVGFVAGSLAGAIKEWWDSKGHGTVELMDFIFTMIGALCGALVALIVCVLFNIHSVLSWLLK
ncbi:MAG: putative periplasmic lipoprotein [Bacteriophage sp.]|nr:MAG: putative periplasmic lipoprotein [Bacteriophage sp.]